jgi:ATP-binding cassette subfamily B protein
MVLIARITKEFDDDGINLSGGESQKLAITRGLYKDCSIIILDEPSSALDPISEYKINNTMLNISSDKTVIIISHRLSTTKMVDKIYMLENGSIIEQGNHNELMKLNGKYAQMFNMQAEKYRYYNKFDDYQYACE